MRINVVYFNLSSSFYDVNRIFIDLGINMAGPTGFEPAISSSTERHVNRYTTGPIKRGLVYQKSEFRSIIGRCLTTDSVFKYTNLKL